MGKTKVIDRIRQDIDSDEQTVMRRNFMEPKHVIKRTLWGEHRVCHNIGNVEEAWFPSLAVVRVKRPLC